MQMLKLMAEIWPLVVGVVGAIAAAAVTLYQVGQHKRTLEEHGKLLGELADVDKVVRGRLYTKEGMTIFMPKVACDQRYDACHKSMDEKFEAMERFFAARFDTLEKLLQPGRN